MDNFKISDIIKQYSIELMSVEFEKEEQVLPDKIGLAVNMHYENIEKLPNNEFKVKVFFGVIATDPDAMSKLADNDKRVHKDDISDQDGYFFIQSFYNVNIETTKKVTNEALKEYAWIVLHPELKQSINSLLSRSGLPNINIPTNIKQYE